MGGASLSQASVISKPGPNKYNKGGYMDIQTAIRKEKEKLIRKAKKKGIWETFGQREVRKLTDNYPGQGMAILEFEEWAMDFNNEDLK